MSRATSGGFALDLPSFQVHGASGFIGLPFILLLDPEPIGNPAPGRNQDGILSFFPLGNLLLFRLKGLIPLKVPWEARPKSFGGV